MPEKSPHPRPFSTRGEGRKTSFIPTYVFDLCRKLRKEPTTAEKLLWRCLCNHQLNGLKFRRQHPLGRYISDFYCAEAGLVIELEGKVHSRAERREYDKIRKEELEARGLRVMRFDNEEVLKRTERVLAKINAAAPERRPHPGPSP